MIPAHLAHYPEAFRIPVFLAVLAVMFTAESLWAKRPWETMRSRRWIFHLTLTVINTLMTRLLIFAPLVAWIAWVQEWQWGIARFLGLEGIPEILITVLVYDSYNYWWHRLNHEVPLLWRFHQVHHMDTQVDVTTSLRFHPGELFLAYLAKAFWVLIWGPSLAAFLVSEMAITAYAQFHHGNIDFPEKIERILRWIHMTPRLHASHHTITPRTRNANYTTIFSLWDRLFGTFREPDPEEMKQLGLSTGREDYLSFKVMMRTPFYE